jgi:heptose I phosphotransferase
MKYGTFWDRLVRGTRWVWLAERYRAALPADLPDTVMDWETRDRYHAKQGRSTARVRFDAPSGPFSVYLKRHLSLPWPARLGALVHPGGRYSPASAEWAHLERARALGLAVPEVVAAGERIGPWGTLQSFLMVAELTGRRELNEALPALAQGLPHRTFARLKRHAAIAMASIAARLHNAQLFHKDFYLCHFFIALPPGDPVTGGLELIDLHRLGEHRLTALHWRWKDLGQLLYSTFDVEPIDDRDRLRFWKHYRRLTGLRWEHWHRAAIRAKAARYLAHNRRGTRS